jgi:hypothetical protein
MLPSQCWMRISRTLRVILRQLISRLGLVVKPDPPRPKISISRWIYPTVRISCHLSESASLRHPISQSAEVVVWLKDQPRWREHCLITKTREFPTHRTVKLTSYATAKPESGLIRPASPQSTSPTNTTNKSGFNLQFDIESYFISYWIN